MVSTSRSTLPSTYKVVFLKRAQKAFDKLDSTIRSQISRKLLQRCTNPRVPRDTLSGMKDCYNIKLRASGFRVVYQVQDAKVVILVISVGKREREESYREALIELSKLHD